MTEPTHLLPSQLATRLHRSVSTLAHWRVAGDGPKFIPGRPVLYPIAEVEAWEARELKGSTAG